VAGILLGYILLHYFIALRPRPELVGAGLKPAPTVRTIFFGNWVHQTLQFLVQAIFRRAASYVDRILRGEKPGDHQGVPSTQMLRYLRRVDDVTNGRRGDQAEIDESFPYECATVAPASAIRFDSSQTEMKVDTTSCVADAFNQEVARE
jgi:hypothetical protein